MVGAVVPLGSAVIAIAVPATGGHFLKILVYARWPFRG